MSTIPVDARRFVELAKNWGFEEVRNSGDHRILKAPTGQQISVRRGDGEINDNTLQMACRELGMNQSEFLAGPKIKKGGGRKGIQATQPRRHVIEFLARQPGQRIDDKSGRATGVLSEGIETSATGLNALLTAMARDGQIIREVHGRRTMSIQLIPDGPRVKEMMPLDLQTPVNAHLMPEATAEPEVAATPKVGDVREPGTLPTIAAKPAPVEGVDLSQYAPDDIAAALMARVIDTIRDGSQSIHADTVWKLEHRLGEQMNYSEGQRRKRTEAEDELARAKERIRNLEEQLRKAQRQSRIVPKEVVDGILVNGRPR